MGLPGIFGTEKIEKRRFTMSGLKLRVLGTVAVALMVTISVAATICG